jgi:DNA-directed RNA polymerase sigma subunit (sigma70/sigma32)
MIGDRLQQQKVERNQQIAKMRRDGATYKEISKAYGISVERVRQIVWRQKVMEKNRRVPGMTEAWIE